MNPRCTAWILALTSSSLLWAQGQQAPAPSAAEQAPESSPAPGQATLKAQRLFASALLERGLSAPAADVAERLKGLKRSALEAARELEGQRVGELLRAAVEQARWRATVDAAGAAQALAERLADLGSDLRFEPRMEAPLPKGFPGPTAVHEIEVKRYPRYRLAQTSMQDGRQNGAFWRLFGHIKENDIPMTAPVETTLAAEGERLVEARMAFLYEAPEQGPASAQDQAVSVETIEPMTVLSLGCRGNDSRARIEQAHSLLQAWLAANPTWRPAGPLRTFGYNSPMVRGDQRTFEVQLPIEPALQNP